MDQGDDEEGDLGGMFPEDARPPTPPSTSQLFPLPPSHPHHPSSLTIHLVSDNPLWGHLLWNASRSISEYLSDNAQSIVRDKNVIEFGAGGGLPGLICAGLGAKKVVITDYPEAVLLDNLARNVRENGQAGLLSAAGDEVTGQWEEKVSVAGHIWGKRPAELLSVLPPEPGGRQLGYDLLILSDLIFNHSQHVALLDSMLALIRPTQSVPVATLQEVEDDPANLPKTYRPDPAPITPGSTDSDDPTPLVPPPNRPRALIFFSHHLPHHIHRDLLFFHRATQRGWVFRRVCRTKVGVMFEEDDEKLASVVHGMGKGGRDVREIVEGWEMWRP